MRPGSFPLRRSTDAARDRATWSPGWRWSAPGEFLTQDYPGLSSLSGLQREHIEAYCRFVPTRHWRGQRACDNRIGAASVIAGLIALRGFLDDIAAWGWAEAPPDG